MVDVGEKGVLRTIWRFKLLILLLFFNWCSHLDKNFQLVINQKFIFLPKKLLQLQHRSKAFGFLIDTVKNIIFVSGAAIKMLSIAFHKKKTKFCLIIAEIVLHVAANANAETPLSLIDVWQVPFDVWRKTKVLRKNFKIFSKSKLNFSPIHRKTEKLSQQISTRLFASIQSTFHNFLA